MVINRPASIDDPAASWTFLPEAQTGSDSGDADRVRTADICSERTGATSPQLPFPSNVADGTLPSA